MRIIWKLDLFYFLSFSHFSGDHQLSILTFGLHNSFGNRKKNLIFINKCRMKQNKIAFYVHFIRMERRKKNKIKR